MCRILLFLFWFSPAQFSYSVSDSSSSSVSAAVAAASPPPYVMLHCPFFLFSVFVCVCLSECKVPVGRSVSLCVQFVSVCPVERYYLPWSSSWTVRVDSLLSTVSLAIMPLRPCDKVDLMKQVPGWLAGWRLCHSVCSAAAANVYLFHGLSD